MPSSASAARSNSRGASARKADTHGGGLDDALLARLGDAALRIHQGGREWPLPTFQERAFDVLRGLIPFDSGMWGTASNDPNHIHNVHLDRQPREMIERYVVGGFQETDPIRAPASSNPGVTIRLSDISPKADWLAHRYYREFSSKWGICWCLCTVQIEPVSSLVGFMSLWRRDPDDDFSDTERHIKQFMTPHMMDAHREARLRHLRAGAPSAGATRQASAICDRFGILHTIEDAFLALLRLEWPAWRSARLPGPLADLAQSLKDAPYRGNAIVVVASHVSDLMLLEARRISPLDRLTDREREIARLYATGKSNQEIADILQISAATVRNHLATLYRKLQISNKAQLVRLAGETPF